MQLIIPFLSLSLSEFIDPSAPHMINLSAIAFEEATKDLENPQRYAFTAAQVRTTKNKQSTRFFLCLFLLQEQVYSLMKNDIYPRFLKTDYEILLKTAHTGGSYGKRYAHFYMCGHMAYLFDVKSCSM